MINEILRDLINCWKQYNGKTDLTEQEASDQINRGDCGMSAITVNYVLREKFNIQTAIVVNRNHCWLILDGKDYDTRYPAGYPADNPANAQWSRGDLDPVHELEFKSACDEWMPCDSHGGFLVKAFVERYGLNTPAELQHCIDKVAEYEAPSAIPDLEARYLSARHIPLPAGIASRLA